MPQQELMDAIMLLDSEGQRRAALEGAELLARCSEAELQEGYVRPVHEIITQLSLMHSMPDASGARVLLPMTEPAEVFQAQLSRLRGGEESSEALVTDLLD
jgi:hypothetical protein